MANTVLVVYGELIPNTMVANTYSALVSYAGLIGREKLMFLCEVN